VVANSDDRVQPRRVRPCEFVPALAAKFVNRKAMPLEYVQRQRMHGAFGVTASTERLELTLPPAIEECFRQDASGGVARAKEQDVVHRQIAFDMHAAEDLQSERTSALALTASGASFLLIAA